MGLGLNNIEEFKLPEPKYFDEEGNEQPINLAVVPSDLAQYEYENTTNLIKTYFKKNICDYSPIRVVSEKGYFDWTPFGFGFQDEYNNEYWLGRINDVFPEVHENKIQYKDCINGIDEEFIVEPGKLKHNTILNYLPQHDGSLVGSNVSFVVEGKMDFTSTISMFVDDVLQSDDFATQKSIVLFRH